VTPTRDGTPHYARHHRPTAPGPAAEREPAPPHAACRLRRWETPVRVDDGGSATCLQERVVIGDVVPPMKPIEVDAGRALRE